jgi:hypothetical protein
VEDLALPRVIYIGGLGRSGTTLLERMLGELPGVSSVGEVVHMWERGVIQSERCGCGAAFDSCPFWRAVGQAAFGGWSEVDVDRIAELRGAVDRTRFIPQLASSARRPSSRADIDEYASYYLRVYAAIAEVSGCGTVVDSSKHASLAFCLRTQPQLDIRVIHVIRDSRAVAYSWTRQVSRPDSAETTFMTTYSPAAAAAQWIGQNGALQVLMHARTPVLRIRYEDLVESPEQVMTQAARFAGVDIAESSLGFLRRDAAGAWAELGGAHSASGNPMRFKTGRIDIRADDEWRTEMPSAQRRTVTALTLPLLARYGYLGRAV